MNLEVGSRGEVRDSWHCIHGNKHQLPDGKSPHELVWEPPLVTPVPIPGHTAILFPYHPSAGSDGGWQELGMLVSHLFGSQPQSKAAGCYTSLMDGSSAAKFPAKD